MERLYWLIRLRWFAAAGVALTILFAGRALDVPLPYAPLYFLAAALGAYNLLFLLYLSRLRAGPRPDLPAAANRLANAQISLDLLSLTALLHFSGGVENPFSYYFVFHMIIASVLLSRRASYLQATLAVFLFLLLAGLEYSGLLAHYCVAASAAGCRRAEAVYLLGVCAAFASTLYIAVYMAASVSLRLREKEAAMRLANVQLKEKDRIKSNYVLRVSHDVKDHLAAILACMDPVLHGLTGELKPAQESMIRRSYERTEKLTVFVKALLEITRIKLSKRMEMESFSLIKTADSAINFVEERARAKNIKLTCAVGPGVEMFTGAQIYIEETIANFLSNSIKYTPEGGSVDLMIGDAGASVLIRVSDTGMGIPKADLPHIFEEFYRAKNAKATERTGTGLGLSIAKEVAVRHGGRIWAESREGKGSVFYLSLPKQTPAPGEPVS